MYQVGVPEKLFKERTGHRSVDGLHRYEQIPEAQLVDISSVELTMKLLQHQFF